MSKKKIQYIVKALSVSGTHNRILSAGDVVEEDYFPDGHAAKLVAEGFLEEYSGETTDEPVGVQHTVSAADVERNPTAGLKEGDKITLPYDGFVLNDTNDQATNESGLASHDGGKVLVPASEAKDPITPVPTPPAPVEPAPDAAKALVDAVIEQLQPGGSKSGGKKKD